MSSENFKADWGLILLRLYIGAMFGLSGWSKLTELRQFQETMISFLRANRNAAYDFYWPFVEKVVLPNTALIAKFVAGAELAIGAGLIVGFMTRWAALGGALLMLNLWCTKGIAQTNLLSTTQYDIILFAVFVFLMFSRAGYVLGLDGRYAQRWKFLR